MESVITPEVIFIVFSIGMLVALIVAIWKLGNSVPAWMIDLAQAGAGVGLEHAKETETTIDEEIWLEILERLDTLEQERNEVPPPTN